MCFSKIYSIFFSYSTDKTESSCANSSYTQCLKCFSYLLTAVKGFLRTRGIDTFLQSICRICRYCRTSCHFVFMSVGLKYEVCPNETSLKEEEEERENLGGLDEEEEEEEEEEE